MNTTIERFSPPGYNTKWEKRFMIFGISLSVFISLSFVACLIADIKSLYYVDGGKRYLKENAICATFPEIAGALFYCFTVTAVTCLFFIAIRRLYLNQNSKSIYTVKRLPHTAPVFKLVAPAPIIYFLSMLFIKYSVLLVYLLVYLISVPKQALPANWFEGFWRL